MAVDHDDEDYLPPAKKKTETPKVTQEEPIVPKDDLSVHVTDAALKRGLQSREYDLVDTRYLWPGNYRINCYKEKKIADSYFVRFTKEEGILWSEPHLPLAKEGL